MDTTISNNNSKIKLFQLNSPQQAHVKQLINELTEKTKLRKSGETLINGDPYSFKSLVTNDVFQNRTRNNILNIDNSKKKIKNEVENKNLKNNYDSFKHLDRQSKKFFHLNSNTDSRTHNNKKSSNLTGLDKIEVELNEVATCSTTTDKTSLANSLVSKSIQQTEKFLENFQKLNPTVEHKPQHNQQELSYSSIDSSKKNLKPIFKSFNDYQDGENLEKKNIKIENNYFEDNSFINKKVKTDEFLSDISGSSSITNSTNKDFAIDSLVINSLADPNSFNQLSFEDQNVKKSKNDPVYSESNLIKNNSSSTTNLNDFSQNYPLKSEKFKNFDSLNKISVSNALNSDKSFSKKKLKLNNFILAPDFESTKYSFPVFNNELNQNSVCENFIPKKLSNEDQNKQSIFKIEGLSSSNLSDHLTVVNDSFESTEKFNKISNRIKHCSTCGDNLLSKKKMSNSPNSTSATAAAIQNADAYLSRLSAQQLNQLIIDQALNPQNNTSNSTNSNNSLNNHTNGNVFDSESSEQFRRLLCQKCRPSRPSQIQHTHNSNPKMMRNLNASGLQMNSRYGWNVIKEYSKGSIKRLKRHQKRLRGYARAMRKQNHVGANNNRINNNEISDPAHQAALANIMINAINPSNKLNKINTNSSDFCKECYYEKMIFNNGLINNDYPSTAINNQSSVCLGCYNNLNNALSTLNVNGQNYNLPTNQKLSSYNNKKISENDLIDNNIIVDRFWDVEQWRNKLRKERLKKKERNVLMIVSSIAIIVFIGISYFGTILFLRLTRMQNEE